MNSSVPNFLVFADGKTSRKQTQQRTGQGRNGGDLGRAYSAWGVERGTGSWGFTPGYLIVGFLPRGAADASDAQAKDGR